ncbi:hypothetical protein [Kineococcus sp. SYSU DK005]|uniref:hypothetical protein n=1 Tax=Kineococcus sp. SYSU DK005 TaxID=3383126 RepID=UPI003D7DBD0B
MDSGTGAARPLSEDEAGVLAALLAQDFPGAAQLREQAEHVLAAPGCGCGCGTITLHVTDAGAPRARTLDAYPASADYGAPGEGGVVTLVTAGGLLAELRLSWWGERPTPMPRPADLEHLWCAAAGG